MIGMIPDDRKPITINDFEGDVLTEPIKTYPTIKGRQFEGSSPKKYGQSKICRRRKRKK